MCRQCVYWLSDHCVYFLSLSLSLMWIVITHKTASSEVSFLRLRWHGLPLIYHTRI